MTTSCPDDNRLSRMIDGGIESAELDAIERHLSACSACTAAVRELGAMLAPGEPETPAPGLRIGRYRVIDELGAGGMGVVYLAEDEQLGRQVAIKLLRPELAAGDPAVAAARLMREARALARLSHPNVIAVYDVGELGGRTFIALELVDGDSLASRAVEPAVAIDLYRQAARGLAAAHRAGIVHRDVKPQNLLVGTDGRVRVSDFGLAAEPAGDDPPLTGTGGVVGTPAYMAPEQQRGETPTARSDQFALCLSLAEALVRARPAASVSIATLRAMWRDAHPDAAAPEVALVALARGLCSDPAHRFETMDELASALAAHSGGRKWWPAMVAVGIAAIAIALVWPRQPDPDRVVVTPVAAKVAAGEQRPVAPTTMPAEEPRPTGPVSAREPPAAPLAASRKRTPSTPAPARAATLEGEALALLQRAMNQSSTDPADCLRTLDQADRVAPRSPQLAHARASCEIAAGQCKTGLRRMRGALRDLGMAADAIDNQVAAAARVQCPVGERPPAERVSRLAAAIARAADAGDYKRCASLHADLERAAGSIEDTAAIDRIRRDVVRCYVTDDRCGEARALWRNLFPGRADEFSAAHPACDQK